MSTRSRKGRVLLVDIGNTRIKWASWHAGRIGRQRAREHEGWRQRDFEQQVFNAQPAPTRIIVVSVAAARVNRAFAAAARRRLALEAEMLRSVRRGGGVTTRYLRPWRLGVDRFVAVIAAHHLAGAHAALAVDVGTAVTLDLIDRRGIHRGGAILPGPELMTQSLLRGTSGIGRRARGGGGARGLFARDTRAAIAKGSQYAVAALIDRAAAEARRELGRTPLVVLSGGAAPSVAPLIRSAHRSIPDLVLRGAALHAGLSID
jgi:type III pantothenate kinase